MLKTSLLFGCVGASLFLACTVSEDPISVDEIDNKANLTATLLATCENNDVPIPPGWDVIACNDSDKLLTPFDYGLELEDFSDTEQQRIILRSQSGELQFSSILDRVEPSSWISSPSDSYEKYAESFGLLLSSYIPISDDFILDRYAYHVHQTLSSDPLFMVSFAGTNAQDLWERRNYKNQSGELNGGGLDFHPGALFLVIQCTPETPSEELLAEIAKLQKQLEDIREQIHKVYDDFESGTIDIREANRQVKILQSQLIATSKELSDLRNSVLSCARD